MLPILDKTTRSILEMVVAAFSFSVMATCVKFACQTLPAIEVVFFRSLLGSLVIAMVMAQKKVSWIGVSPKVNIMRGISGFIALALHFYCIQKLDLGTAVMLNYTAPIFVVILAYIFLKEKTSWMAILAICLSFAGLYLLVAPQFEVKPVPITLGLISGIFAAIAYTLIRLSEKEESPYTIIFYFTVISTIGSAPLLKFGFSWPNGVEWLALIGVTSGAFFGQVFLTHAIRGAPVAVVLPFGYLTPVFATTFGIMFWQEFLTLQAMVGGSIIIICGVSLYLLRRKLAYVPLEE